MKDSFLPTMPEEVLSAEIRNELQRMEELANKYHHSVTWYRKYMILTLVLSILTFVTLKSKSLQNILQDVPMVTRTLLEM